MKRNPFGFTLLELMITICIIAALIAVAAPTYQQWAENARYREAARDAASVLREAQSMAVSKNTSYKVVFDLDNNSYTLQKNSTTVEDYAFPNGLTIRGASDCNQSSGSVAITMNPNGSADSPDYVCVMDGGGHKLYRTAVVSIATGRVVVQKWDEAGSSWK